MTNELTGASPLLRARVLVVEDERIIAKDIEQTLKSLGYTVCGVVDTGEEAIRTALKEKLDLVLMDVRIRGAMDGIEAAGRIREQLDVPVVFLTAFADEATLKRARDTAPYGYVLKPFDDRDLQSAAMMALAKHSAFQALDERVRERTDALLKSEARFRQIAAVAELGIFALGNHDLDAVFEQAVRVICATLDTGYSGVLEATPEGTAFRLRARLGWPETVLDGRTLPGGKGSQPGYTLLTSEPVISNDYSQEQRFRLPDELVAEGITSGMTVVIHGESDSKPYGILATHSKSRRSFTASEAAFLQAVANLIATTVARVRAERQRVEAERRAEEERVRAAQAEDAVRLRDEFLSIASHELKTPLTSVQLQLQSLAQRPEALGEKVAGKLNRATRSVKRLGSLVESLLDVSTIASGHMELKPEPFRLEELVDEVVDRLPDDWRAALCELRVERPSGSITGRWDRGRIEQVITNLISNACNSGGECPIEIRLARAGDEAEIKVKDEGRGIAQEDLERIFGRFERAVSDRNYGGLGLGLYISRQIVEAHGGTIRAESEPGRGSTFIVRLPIGSIEGKTS